MESPLQPQMHVIHPGKYSFLNPPFHYLFKKWKEMLIITQMTPSLPLEEALGD